MNKRFGRTFTLISTLLLTGSLIGCASTTSTSAEYGATGQKASVTAGDEQTVTVTATHAANTVAPTAPPVSKQAHNQQKAGHRILAAGSHISGAILGS